MSTEFTIIKNEIMLDPKLSTGSRTLYFILSSYCYADKTECFPSQSTLAKQLGKSIRQIQRYLKELVENKIISIKNRGHLTNVYKMLQKVIINKAVTKVKSTISRVKQSYKNKKKSNWDNFEQRDYNYEELERKLLGWT